MSQKSSVDLDLQDSGLDEFENDLASVLQDEFAAERLKSLFAGLLAEFRTQTANMALTEEEQQHYNLLNEKRGDQLLMKLNVFASVGKR